MTSLGIVLGFLLSYLGGWANSSGDDGVSLFADGTDVTIFCTIVIAVAILICVLYRMLNPRVPAEDPLGYYHRTLRPYVLGIVVAFGGFLMAWII